MEDWKVLYASKLMTADEAVRQIPDGSRVFFGHAANEPPVLVDALVRNYEQYKDVEIVHWVPMERGVLRSQDEGAPSPQCHVCGRPNPQGCAGRTGGLHTLFLPPVHPILL